MSAFVQLLLPIKKWDLSEREFRWFFLANSGSYALKKIWYGTKAKILQDRAVPDGADLQVLTKDCWSCSGTGLWGYTSARESCNRCDGSGIYSITHVHLARWVLNGRIFHVPSRSDYRPDFPYRERFDRVISHAWVCPRSARAAALRLMGKFDPERLQNLSANLSTRRTTAWIYAPTSSELADEKHWAYVLL